MDNERASACDRVRAGDRVLRSDRADDGRVEPGVAAGPAGAGGRGERADDRAGRHGLRAARAATAARSRRRTSTRWRPEGLLYTNMHTTALCSPSRSCIITGRNHHANATAAITELATGYPGYNGQIPFENGFLSEMLPQHGYNTYMVGKWHLMPSEYESAAGPYDRWPLGRGFERFYGFLGGDTSQWYPGPGLRQPPGRAAALARGGLPPDRGPGRQGDRVHRRRQAGRPGQAVLPALLHRAPRTPRTTWRKEWADRYTGPVRRRLGRLPGAGLRPAEGARASCRPTPSCRGTTPTSRSGTRSRRTPGGSPPRMMEVFAGFLSHTDHHIGRLLDFLRETGELDNTLSCWCPTTGPAPRAGRPAPPTRRSSSTTPPSRWRTASTRSTSSAARRPSTTTRGAGRGPATRRSAGGSARPTAAARRDPFLVHWPARHQGPRRDPRPVRPHHRHGPDRPRRARGRAAGHDQGRHAVADPRRQLRPHLRRRGRRDAATAPSTSRCSATAPSTTTAGGRSARGRARRSPRPASPFGTPITAEMLGRPRRRRLGALPRRRGLRPRTTTSPPSTATSSSS